MAAGLFELRRDAITGWWVATIVDRAFHRDRFARAAAPVEQEDGCQNCREPAGDGVRLRILKDYAFHVVGHRGRGARSSTASLAQVAIEQARASGSWRTVVAPPGEHRPLQAVGDELIGVDAPACAATRSPSRAGPARPTTSRSSRTGAPRPAPGPTTCASTCTTCPRCRIGSPRRSAAPPGS